MAGVPCYKRGNKGSQDFLQAPLICSLGIVYGVGLRWPEREGGGAGPRSKVQGASLGETPRTKFVKNVLLASSYSSSTYGQARIVLVYYYYSRVLAISIS